MNTQLCVLSEKEMHTIENLKVNTTPTDVE